MNEIAAKLGEVGLPEPVGELAARDWDAVVVGGGHNGLTAAAYLARAGRIGARARAPRAARRRLHPRAAVRRRPLRRQPLRLRRRPARRAGDPRARAASARGLRYWMADPNLWVPVRGRHRLRPVARRLAAPRRTSSELGVSKRDIEGYWAYEELFDEVAQLLARASATPGSATRRPAAEIEELLGGDRDDRPPLRGVDRRRPRRPHLRRAAQDRPVRPGDHRHLGRARRTPGTASIKLMHFQGDMDGQGPLWGYVEGGMGMVSFAIADAAREAGAVLACGVPVSEILPGEGVTLEDGTSIRAAHRDLERRSEAEPWACSTARRSTAATASVWSAGRSAAPWSSSTPRSTGCRTGPRRPARTGRLGPPST